MIKVSNSKYLYNFTCCYSSIPIIFALKFTMIDRKERYQSLRIICREVKIKKSRCFWKKVPMFLEKGRDVFREV